MILFLFSLMLTDSLINDDDNCLIRDYAFRDSDGRMENGNLNYRYFIKMKHIEIFKEKIVIKFN